MVSSDESADDNVSSVKLQQRLSSHRGMTVSQEIHNNTIHSSKTEGVIITSSVTAEEVQDTDATGCVLQKDQEGTTCCLPPPEKPLQSPNTLPHALQSGHDSPSLIREKVSKDGYNWRKYGQKHVKGNEFIRSYYKCTHPNCYAKKQLELSTNGQITDTICIGQHSHPRPQLNTPPPVDIVVSVEEKPGKPSSANAEEKTSVEQGCVSQQIKPQDSLPISTVSSDEVKAVHLQLTRVKNDVHNNEDPESKRLKKDKCNADVVGIEKSTGESRVVVQTSSEVDFVNDGYRWRKYGQKLVKGNPNPRSYYRCSNPGCPAKKHVERASHDLKILITTYEGLHDHEMPLGKTISNNAAGNTQTMANNSEPRTQSEGDTSCVDTGKNSCLDSENRLYEQLKGKTSTNSKVSEGCESNSTEQRQQNGNSGANDDSVILDIIVHSSSETPCRSKEQLKGDVRTNSEGSKEDCLDVVSLRDSHGPENILNKQPISDAEPVQS